MSWHSAQLEVSSAAFKSYEWKSRTWDYHLALIRDHFGFRPCEVKDLKNLSDWLIEQPRKTPSSNHLFDVAIKRLRFLRIELPTEKELQRLVNSVRQKFFDRLYQTIFEKVDQKTRKLMDQCLETCGTEGSRYDWIKSKPGTLGMKTILKETEKLNFIKTFNLNYKVLFLGIPQELLLELKGRAKCEDSYQMRRHPLAVRCSLLAVLLYFRHREITDDIVRLFLELIRRIEKKADKSMEKELICDIKKVYGKRKILYKIARAARERPDGTIREVIFKEVKEEILDRIVEEFESENLEWDYDNSRTKTMKRKYSRHYRRMLKPVLEVLVFQANNPAHQPILDGLDLVRKYVDTKHIYYPKHEEVPAKLLNSPWKDVVYEETKKGCRVVKHYFELCVLQKLEKALKCKEIWVEGSYRFRNPDDDLPHDWEQSRLQYCEKLKIPSNAEDFIEPIRKEMIGSLQEANEFFSRKQDVYIYHPGKGEKGLFRIPKILKRPERPILQEIKNRVLSRWGILNLIDVLVEADRQVNFSRFFTTTGQRQVLSDDEVKERLILSLFSIGTNLGLKRIYSAAEPSCSYEDLLYFRKRYLWIDPVREAIAALVNRILEIRNPEI